jgi:hypothetical protein
MLLSKITSDLQQIKLGQQPLNMHNISIVGKTVARYINASKTVFMLKASNVK